MSSARQRAVGGLAAVLDGADERAAVSDADDEPAAALDEFHFDWPAEGTAPPEPPAITEPGPRPPQPSGEPPMPVILVVDGDGVSSRFVELALRRNGVLCLVETARDAAVALELLGRLNVELILAETELPDANGFHLLRQLQQEDRLRGIPFVFFSVDARPATRVLAWRAGADDYLFKPSDPAELAARVASLIGRSRRQREAARRRPFILAGEFSAISFADVVGMLEMGRAGGVLSVVCPSAMGEVHVERGAVVHATFGNLTGREAFYRIMRESGGRFEFSDTLSPAARTINESTTGLMLEAARRHDTARHEAQVRPGATLEMFPLPRPVAPTAGLSPASPLPPAAAEAVARAISDEYCLGQLMLWSHEEVARWTEAPVGRDRVHTLLLAPLSAGITSMLPVAAAPSERVLRRALDDGEKVTGVAWYLRQERVVDLVLVDIHDAGRVLGQLRRRPSLVVVAPPEGELLNLGVRACVEIERLLAETAPLAVLGVGNERLPGRLRDLDSLRRDTAPLACLLGDIHTGHPDLRTQLAAGIRLAAAESSAP